MEPAGKPPELEEDELEDDELLEDELLEELEDGLPVDELLEDELLDDELLLEDELLDVPSVPPQAPRSAVIPTDKTMLVHLTVCIVGINLFNNFMFIIVISIFKEYLTASS